MARILLDKELETLKYLLRENTDIGELKGDIRILYLANGGLETVDGKDFVDPNVTHKVLAVMARNPEKYRIDEVYGKQIDPWSDYQPVLEEIASLTRGSTREEAVNRADAYFRNLGFAKPDVDLERFRILCSIDTEKGGLGIPEINTDGQLIPPNSLDKTLIRYVKARGGKPAILKTE